MQNYLSINLKQTRSNTKVLPDFDLGQVLLNLIHILTGRYQLVPQTGSHQQPASSNEIPSNLHVHLTVSSCI